MSLKAAVISQFEQVAREQGKQLKPITDDLLLLDSGLDSLCFAIIVARLEDTLGIDPFSGAGEFRFPLTVGEFVQFYQRAERDV